MTGVDLTTFHSLLYTCLWVNRVITIGTEDHLDMQRCFPAYKKQQRVKQLNLVNHILSHIDHQVLPSDPKMAVYFYMLLKV